MPTKGFIKMQIMSKAETGLSLIELLIGILLGTIVAAGAIGVYVMSIKGQSDNIQLARLNQDMRAMMDIMVRDIRRAGFVTDNPEPAPDGYLTSLQDNPFFADDDDLAIYNDKSCIVYAYNRYNDKPPEVKDKYRFGFRLNGSQLQMRKSGTTNANCNSDRNNTWESITEPEVEITELKFEFTPNPSPTLNVSSMSIDDDDDDGFFNGDNLVKNGLCDKDEDCTKCSSGDACLTIRTVSISLSGRLRDDHNVTQKIDSRVRIRNDKYEILP